MITDPKRRKGKARRHVSLTEGGQDVYTLFDQSSCLTRHHVQVGPLMRPYQVTRGTEEKEGKCKLGSQQERHVSSLQHASPSPSPKKPNNKTTHKNDALVRATSLPSPLATCNPANTLFSSTCRSLIP
ncbi:hypothetical protein PIB30_077571 [Stylosanthes scabra]|uniref:Uncharacterized protein n=1 Tax=Stylosanthes scabra TaxID=79078 RepID=A0ABU6RRB4_9FABA|nr:hypothetical protein [Stylosanthes scabra]